MKPKYRFTGHETFPCRYTWLPKAILAIRKSPHILSSDDDAMVELGVGKNMVRAIRFWAFASGIAINLGAKGWAVTPFGETLLGPEGLDPFLEDRQTLWLIHWKLSTQFEEPLFAWEYMFSRWFEPEFTRSSAVKAFDEEAKRQERKLSYTTLRHHFDTFIHTYVVTKGIKPSVFEAGLDSPLVELNLIQRVGDRVPDLPGGKREPVYAFRREEKPDISSRLFAYCVADFAARKHQDEATISFRELSIGVGSPGQVFKLTESSVRERLESILMDSAGLLSFQESADIQQIVFNDTPQTLQMLAAIYHGDSTYA